MKTSNLILILVITMTSSALAQQNIEPVSYRIVAVNSNNTKQSISNEIELHYPLQLHIPTAFTPNGDGLNDTFGAKGEGITEFKLTIFNRWGSIVYTTNSITDRWDGSYSGKPVQPGIYNYEVLAYAKEQGQVHRTGQLTVLN